DGRPGHEQECGPPRTRRATKSDGSQTDVRRLSPRHRVAPVDVTVAAADQAPGHQTYRENPSAENQSPRACFSWPLGPSSLRAPSGPLPTISPREPISTPVSTPRNRLSSEAISSSALRRSLFSISGQSLPLTLPSEIIQMMGLCSSERPRPILT